MTICQYMRAGATLRILLLVFLGGLLGACRFGAPPYFEESPPTQPQIPVFCYGTLADAECHPTPQEGRENQFNAVYQADALDPTRLDYWTTPPVDELGNPTGPPRFVQSLAAAGQPIPLSRMSEAPVSIGAGRIGTASREAYTARSTSPYARPPSTMAGVSAYPTPPVTATPLPPYPPPATTAGDNPPRALFAH